jgi:adenylate cyclase
MGKEIERKFLVRSDDWRGLGQGIRYRQGYLSTVEERVVRVRTVGNQGYLTIKGLTRGATRAEFEYPIPVKDANAMLDGLCERPLIEKVRYRVEADDVVWEIDEFERENRGLLIAEVELRDEEQEIAWPPWIGNEVTGDPRYFNSNLIAHPYTTWNLKP